MATWDWWSLPAPETEFAHNGGYRKNQPDWGEPDQHHHPPVAAPSFKAEDTGCDLDFLVGASGSTISRESH